MRVAVGEVNAQILRLAPVLTARTLTGGVDVTSGDDAVPVNTLVKSQGGDLWIVSTAMRMGTTQATFTVQGAGAGTVEVVDEDRSLRLENGSFRDDFEPDYAVHIYRIPGAG